MEEFHHFKGYHVGYARKNIWSSRMLETKEVMSPVKERDEGLSYLASGGQYGKKVIKDALKTAPGTFKT